MPLLSLPVTMKSLAAVAHSARRMMRRWLRRIYMFVDGLLAPGNRAHKQHLREQWPGLDSRFHYQKELNSFDIKGGEIVLDVGSGHKPFPYATILGDRFVEATEHRHQKLMRDHRPIVILDIEHMPFARKSINFVYCSHVLEHVENPDLACKELIRVGKRGYIEMPTFMKDALFAWAQGMHRWYAAAKGNALVFFEYDERESRGIGSPIFHNIIFDECYHPLQDVFRDNQDIFNIMFGWTDTFEVQVYRNEKQKVV